MMESATARELFAGQAAEALIAATLANEDCEILSWSLHSIHDRPGAEITAGYQVSFRTPAGDDDTLYLSVTTADLSRYTAKVVTLNSPMGTLWAWRHPEDPQLPGLAKVSSLPAFVQGLPSLCTRLGQVDELELLAYRPLRRAVLRAHMENGDTVFVKVLPPDKALELVERHSLLEPWQGLSPRVIYADERGIVVTEERSEPSLSQQLATPEGREQFDAHTLVRALSALPTSLTDLPLRVPPSQKLRHYVATAIEVHPDLAAQLATLVARLDPALDVPGEQVPTHGDVNTTNVLMDSGRVCGLIDLDTVGPGHLVDDLACALAHLAALSSFNEKAFSEVDRYLDGYIDAFALYVDRATLLRRAAAHLVALIAGSEDGLVARQWLNVVLTWADDREQLMRELSSEAPLSLILEPQD